MKENEFFEFCIDLLYDTGHAVAKKPIFYNHSAKEVLYFDSKINVSLSKGERQLVYRTHLFSHLFNLSGTTFTKSNNVKIAYYSYVINETNSSRSQVALESHRIFQKFGGTEYSIALVLNENHFVFSFAESNGRVILSDWYSVWEPELEIAAEKLSVGNISFFSSEQYFLDLSYLLARNYYTSQISPEYAAYEMFPVNYPTIMNSATVESLDREQIRNIITGILSKPEEEYGDDFVEYTPGSDVNINQDISSLELEILNFDLELLEDEEKKEQEIDEGFMQDVDEEDEKDEYGYENVDSELFKDPTKLLKWLEDKNNSRT